MSENIDLNRSVYRPQPPKKISISIVDEPGPVRIRRVNACLEELKKTLQLSRDLLLEFKELLVVMTLILFFALGVWGVFSAVERRPSGALQPPAEMEFHGDRDR